jgi:hypothetical protein
VTLEVIGAGFSRTGTTSLRIALEQLGRAPCYHATDFDRNEAVWWEILAGRAVPSWERLFEGYRAALDFPIWMFFEPLAETFPDALVLLSRRDPERWYRSFHDTVYSTLRAGVRQPDAEVRRWAEPRYEHIVVRPFGGRFEDREAAIKVYLEHMDRVQLTVPAERLLVYDVAEGWEPLCRRLREPVPGSAFPHANSTQEFQRALQGAPVDNLGLS